MPKAYDYCGIYFYIRNRIGIQHDEPYTEVFFNGIKTKYLIRTADPIPHSKLEKINKKMDRKIRKILRFYREEFLNYWNNEQKDTPDIPRPIIEPYEGKF